MQIYLVLALIFAMIIATFAIQNATLVDISFFIFKFENVSLVLVIFISIFSGAVVTLLLSFIKQFNNIRRIKNLEGYIIKLESQLQSCEQAAAQAPERNEQQSNQ